MSKFLKEAPFDEAMRALSEGRSPHVHTVWTGDFMAMCTHDIACPVCFEASAVIHRNVSIGVKPEDFQRVGPCRACAAKGWEIRRKPWWQRMRFQKETS